MSAQRLHAGGMHAGWLFPGSARDSSMNATVLHKGDIARLRRGKPEIVEHLLLIDPPLG
jgi:hypothetical protein